MTRTTLRFSLLKAVTSALLAGSIASSMIAPASAAGAMKSVAVSKCDGNGAFLNYYGGWEAGGGLAAILATELSNTNQVRVVNRTDLDAAMYEQTLALQGLTAGQSVQAGQMTNAQYFVRCSVTEFSANKKGSGLNLGGGAGGFLGSISPQRRKAHIGIDVQVFSSTTSELVTSFKVEREAKRFAIAANVSHKNFSVGGNKFNNTVLGEAAREALNEAAQRIVSVLSSQAWTAAVAQVKIDTLYVNAGSNTGLRTGDQLTIYRVLERIVDPMTGALLGLEEQMVGTATITEVRDQFAKATYQTSTTPQVGDTLRLVGSSNLAMR